MDVLIVVSIPLAAGSILVSKQVLTQKATPISTPPKDIRERKVPEATPIPSKKEPFKRPPSNSVA